MIRTAIIIILLPFALLGAYVAVMYVLAMRLGAMYPERMRE
jgi:hypothetical protein